MYIYIYNYISHTKKYVQYQLFQKILLRIMNHTQQENVEKEKNILLFPNFPPVTTKDPTFTFCHFRLTQFSF